MAAAEAVEAEEEAVREQRRRERLAAKPEPGVIFVVQYELRGRVDRTEFSTREAADDFVEDLHKISPDYSITVERRAQH